MTLFVTEQDEGPTGENDFFSDTLHDLFAEDHEAMAYGLALMLLRLLVEGFPSASDRLAWLQGIPVYAGHGGES